MPTVSFTTTGVLRKSALRQANERLVLNAIRRNPGIARFELARITGFSKTSVTFVVNRLLKEGLVQEEKLENGKQAGRPPTALHLRADARSAIGVEIAQPDSRVVLVDLNGVIQRERKVPWEADPEQLIDNVYRAVRSVAGTSNAERVLGVGFALPGTIDKPAGRVVAAEALGWFDVEVGAMLRHRLPWPLFFENNANVSALAEQWYSTTCNVSPEQRPLRYFVYIRLRGGLGTGVVVDGRILHGMSSAGSEFGHVMLYADGRPCPCGNRGCWEQYASDAALLRAYRELAGDAAAVIEDPLAVVELARQGDESALRALRTTAFYLGLGYSNVIAVFNPQAIIVGEPLASAWDLIEDVVQAEVQTRVPSYYLRGLRLLASRFDIDSALRGAAALALAHYFTRFDHTKDDSLPIGVAMETHA